MEMSEQINELATALSSFQGEMKAVIFDAVNPYFKSKYATLSALVDNAAPILSKHGLSVSQLCTEDGAVITMLMHKSGQFINSKLKLTPTKNDPQGIGSSITYARRYAYASILGLVSESDDDGNAASVPVSQKVAIPEAPKPFVKPVQDAPKLPTNAPRSPERTMNGILMGSKTRKGVSKEGKEYTITEYQIKDGHDDFTISCFGSRLEAEDWSEVVCKDVTEKEFKGKIQLYCKEIVKKDAPKTAEDINCEE